MCSKAEDLFRVGPVLGVRGIGWTAVEERLAIGYVNLVDGVVEPAHTPALLRATLVVVAGVVCPECVEPVLHVLRISVIDDETSVTCLVPLLDQDLQTSGDVRLVVGGNRYLLGVRHVPRFHAC